MVEPPFSVEFLEKGRDRSTLLGYGSLDEARGAAAALLNTNVAIQVHSIIQWDEAHRVAIKEWAYMGEGRVAPLQYASRTVH